MSGMLKDPRELGAIPIKVDDTFEFSCVGCGNCCRGRGSATDNSIFLSGPDVQRMIQALSINAEEMMSKYLDVHYDTNIGLRLCRLKIRMDGTCRFLNKGKCMIYSARPRTCALYPLGRGFSFTQKGKKVLFSHAEYTIEKNPPMNYKCQKNRTYTVRQWPQENHVPVDDSEDIEWYLEAIKAARYLRHQRRPYKYSMNDAFEALYNTWKDLTHFFWNENE